MKNKIVQCGKLKISNSNKFTLIAGPCQLENEKHALNVAEILKTITEKLGIGLIYKTSFDKANRTSLNGERGTGLKNSLPILNPYASDLVFFTNETICLRFLLSNATITLFVIP